MRDVFDALGNDPFVIAECLARPALADRLLMTWYAYDQRIHGEVKHRAEIELQTHNSSAQMEQMSGQYTVRYNSSSATAPMRNLIPI